MGSRQHRGHGLIRVGSRTDGSEGTAKVYRVTYEHFIGPIPEGLDLDHVVCQFPPCANPWHVEPVTRGENTRRAMALRTHCRKGHDLTVVGFRQLDAGRRMCEVCYLALRGRQNEKRRVKRASRH